MEVDVKVKEENYNQQLLLDMPSVILILQPI